MRFPDWGAKFCGMVAAEVFVSADASTDFIDTEVTAACWKAIADQNLSRKWVSPLHHDAHEARSVEAWMGGSE